MMVTKNLNISKKKSSIQSENKPETVEVLKDEDESLFVGS